MSLGLCSKHIYNVNKTLPDLLAGLEYYTKHVGVGHVVLYVLDSEVASLLEQKLKRFPVTIVEMPDDTNMDMVAHTPADTETAKYQALTINDCLW